MEELTELRMQETKRASWAEIDVSALEHNIREIQQRIGASREIMAVLKADAYGHGALETASILRDLGVHRFAVATISEALQLRRAGVKEPITLLSPCPDSTGEILAENGFVPLLSTYENAKAFSEAAGNVGKPMEVFIAVDTGMCRIGYPTDEEQSLEEIRKISKLPNLQIDGLFSHFACSDETDMSFTQYQHLLFTSFYDKLTAAGVELPIQCIANSGAIMSYPPAWHDIVRPGIILYGYYPSEEVDKSVLDLHPSMQIKARIMRLREVDRGTSVSYGRKYIVPSKKVIATIPIGYADGYPRQLSSKARVIVNGEYAPQVGNICMDQCMIDVTDIPNVKVGDIVTIMGSDGDATVTADELASMCGTINYEILCGFSQRLRRVYKNQK